MSVQGFPVTASLKFERWLFLTFLLLHTIVSYYYISQQNITYDEPQYIEYAKRWLHGKPERIRPLDDSKSPVVAVCWIPRMVRQVINPGYHLTDYGRKDQAEGRYMMMLFSFLAAVYVYRWCRDLYGIKGWWLPLLLLLFDPLYLAYSTLITTDLACGSFLVALLYHYRKYLLTGSRKQLCIAAIYTGLAIVTKQTMVFTLLLLPLLSGAHFFYHRKNNPLIKQVIISAAAFMVFVVFVINLCYYFHHTFLPFGKYVFESQALIHLQSNLHFFHAMPVPLPEAYIQSLDMIMAHAAYGPGRTDSTYSGVYLFGKLHLNGGYWYYYLVTFFYKMPVGNLVLLLASFVLFIKKFNRKNFYNSYMFLVVPVIFFWMLLSFFNNFQTGIRHLLLTFPLLYTGMGKLFYDLIKMKRSYKIAAAILICYTFFSVFLYYPFIIPYTNEFVGNKKKVYEKISDSSIDYGQSDSSANAFISNHTGYSNPSAEPKEGKYAIPLGHIVNPPVEYENRYDWYLKIEPAGLYRNVVLLYNVTKEDLIKAGFSENEIKQQKIKKKLHKKPIL